MHNDILSLTLKVNQKQASTNLKLLNVLNLHKVKIFVIYVLAASEALSM